MVSDWWGVIPESRARGFAVGRCTGYAGDRRTGYDAGLRVEFEFSRFRIFEFSSGLEGGGSESRNRVLSCSRRGLRVESRILEDYRVIEGGC